MIKDQKVLSVHHANWDPYLLTYRINNLYNSKLGAITGSDMLDDINR